MIVVMITMIMVKIVTKIVVKIVVKMTMMVVVITMKEMMTISVVMLWSLKYKDEADNDDEDENKE